MDFYPPVLLKNPHLQTIFADLFSFEKSVDAGQLHTISLPDRDQIVAEYYPGINSFCIILCHGLSGNGRSSYNLRLLKVLKSKGFHVVLFNHRNCGPGWGLSSRPYHSGRGEDIGEAVKYFRELTKCRVGVVGFSMSGNASLRLLAHTQKLFPQSAQDYLPDFCIVSNPPINLKRASILINQGFAKIYQMNFINAFRGLLRRLEKEDLIEVISHQFQWSTSIFQFDEQFTAPNSGFKDAEDYYQQCSTYQQLQQVSVPTLIITSQDDPFVDVQDFLLNKKSATVTIDIQQHGGHMGFLHRDKTPLKNHRWLDYRICQEVALQTGISIIE